ncbi:50S ribosomal protein L14e [Candidatus Woesearchaeota archaeon]|nr:50S ribosomal protein L14e [Candidatus Woesearchaeota archaeon]
MIEIGQICVKIAGRDAEKKCAIVDILEGQYVMIDGETRRRKCNLAHLEPLEEKIEIKKGASHDEVKKAFKKLKITIKDSKPKKTAMRPRKLRRSKLAKTAEPEAKTAEKKVKKKKKKTAKEEKK